MKRESMVSSELFQHGTHRTPISVASGLKWLHHPSLTSLSLAKLNSRDGEISRHIATAEAGGGGQEGFVFSSMWYTIV